MTPRSMPLRVARQVSLPQLGDAGQRSLASSTVAVIGLGGLGNPASLYLASAGVGKLMVNDFDVVDETNLARQVLFNTQDLGRRKANVAAEKLPHWNPELDCEAVDQRLDDEEMAAIADCADLILDCTDNFASRWLINRACFAASTPLVSGAAIRFEGQVGVFPHDGTGPCYECLYTQEDENLDDCAGQGILAPVAGTVGTVMATEAIKLLTGMGSSLSGRLWTYDGLAGSTREFSIRQRGDCPVCNGA